MEYKISNTCRNITFKNLYMKIITVKFSFYTFIHINIDGVSNVRTRCSSPDIMVIIHDHQDGR